MDDRLRYAPCGYFSLTTQGDIQEANQTFLEMTGYLAHELIGKHIEFLLPTASKTIFHSLFFSQLQAQGRVEELYLTLLDKSWKEIPIILVGCKPRGNIKGIDCMVAKMTKRDRYEQELRNIEGRMQEAFLRENKLRKLFETTIFSINEGIIVTDGDGKIAIMNKLAEIYTGWPIKTAKGNPCRKIFHVRDNQGNRPDLIKTILSGGVSEDLMGGNWILLSKDGTERHIIGTVAPLLPQEELSAGIVLSFRDITKEYLQENEINGFLNVNMEMLCVLTANGTFHRINKKFTEILGFQNEDLDGKNFLDFVHKDDFAKTLRILQSPHKDGGTFSLTNRFRCLDGSYKYIEWDRQTGVGEFVYSSGRDVTAAKMREKHLLNIAVRDKLTGLYNRHYLDSYLEEASKRVKTENWPLTLAILDLDYFKQVNDTWGHPIGDDLLKQTAKVIGRTIRRSDLLVRFGGEEFMVVMPNTRLRDAVKAMEKVRLAVEHTRHPISGRQTISIGIAQQRTGEPFSAWYERTDEALYQAKQKGRNCIASCACMESIT